MIDLKAKLAQVTNVLEAQALSSEHPKSHNRGDFKILVGRGIVFNITS